MPEKQNVLVLDIETAPIIAYVWDLFDVTIPINQIHTDRYIISWAAKWLDEPKSKMMYADKRHTGPLEDKEILIQLRDLLDKADIVIGHNVKKFDVRRIVARFIAHKIRPPKPFKYIDTLTLQKEVADFPSNKLEYVTQMEDEYNRKYLHGKFPGFLLWRECLAGNPKAWAELKRYNIHDVVVTERWYHRLKPYISHLMPKIYPLTKGSKHCGTCGYVGRMQEGRPRYANVYKYRQNRCTKCGSWQKRERIP